MTLRALVEKISDTELLCEMVGFTDQRLTKLESYTLNGAHFCKRTEERGNQRNG